VLDTGGCSQANSLGGCERTNRCHGVLGKIPRMSNPKMSNPRMSNAKMSNAKMSNRVLTQLVQF